MYRKPNERDRSGALNLDSLMDILSCLVGVMLFLVIYTVLELGSAAYQAEIPVGRGPPSGREPVVLLAEAGTVRALDVRRPLNQLLSGFEIVRPSDVPVFVEQANRRPPADDFFEYSLTYDDRFSEFGDPLGTLALEIRERGGVPGDSMHQLARSSRYATLLRELDPAEHWLAFEVDSSGVDVFRRARDLAIQEGFTVTWNPMGMEFPLTHTLAGGAPADLLRSRNTVSKPAR